MQIASLMLTGCSWREKKAEDFVSETSIFSWEEEYILPEMEDDVEKAMEKLNCKAVYQQISPEAEEAQVLDYLKRRKEKGQRVYYLAGASDWGVEEDGASMLEAVRITAEWNKKSGTEGGFAGIVFDVEPYLLEEWDDNQENCMEQYAANCIQAYQSAREEKLAVIICIPNFYDRIGLSALLEKIIEEGCDGIAVMNYNKKNEAGQIEEELRLAEKYGKGILNITEMQMQGYHGLIEENTYYDDGFEAVADSWEKLKAKYPYKRLGFSWHYLRPCLQLMEAESE
ncbi:hypothetical protein SAMN05216405_1933 [Lachnospiraceae bacterium NLAE-zl-G231]|nr:hypothetical protein SAMN05216405_1933 [Lachnospiraceae bacterium NLAE-zl-G231]